MWIRYSENEDEIIGYYVSTVGRDEKLIREYVRRQETEDIRVKQLELF
jgi:putative transposase